MKKVLIVTYYWPPSGGSGVQRWLKFVKYLPSFGWEPHVFTPENPSFAVIDPSLESDVPAEAEVIRFPIWEPYDAFFKISGWFGAKKQATPTALVSTQNRSVFQAVSTWVRGNFFVPDPRRFWVKPSVKFLSDYLADNRIDTVITTGPPHSVHLIGLKLKSAYPHLRWLADFRDPWSEWGLLDSLMVTKMARRIHNRMEAQVLAATDDIITITPYYVRRFEKLAKRPVTLLTNGFDEEDFAGIRHAKSERFLIRHVGLVNEKCNPRPFMEVLKKEMEADTQFAKDIRLEFIGEVHPDFRRYSASQSILREAVVFSGSVPHKQLIGLYGSSSLLLLILTGYKNPEGYLPGKLFEYLATGLPILGIGPDAGDAGRLLNETGAGVMIESGDRAGIRKALREAYEEWKRSPVPKVDLTRVGKFSRKSITGQLATILSTR